MKKKSPRLQRLIEKRVNLAYQMFMLFLCVYALLALVASSLIQMDARVREILEYADYAACLVFFFDFVLNLVEADNKWRYLRTWGWIDLLSSIPSFDAFRIGRLARVLRILRVLRAVKATRALVLKWVGDRPDALLYGVVAVAFSMVVLCSVAVLSFENVPNGNIKTAEDALWWAVSTITTVGYGDYYPVTTEGRAVAAMLMTVGVGLLGMLSGFTVNWFLQPSRAKEQSELLELHRKLDELTEAVRRLESRQA